MIEIVLFMKVFFILYLFRPNDLYYLSIHKNIVIAIFSEMSFIIFH